MLTGLLDRSALYGVLAEIEGLGLDVLEVCQLTRTANHQDQVTPAHRDGRSIVEPTSPTIGDVHFGVRRRLTPDDTAAAVAYLASDAAAAMTGQVLCADGGLIMR